MSVYKLTPQGLEWAKSNKDSAANPEGYGAQNYERVQIILSDKFLGNFMVPQNGGTWHYNFNGINFSEHMKFGLHGNELNNQCGRLPASMIALLQPAGRQGYMSPCMTGQF